MKFGMMTHFDVHKPSEGQTFEFSKHQDGGRPIPAHLRARSIYSKRLSRGQHRYGADADCGVLCGDACMYVSFGQGSSLLWTHTLRSFYSRPMALTQEGRSLVNDVCECVRD